MGGCDANSPHDAWLLLPIEHISSVLPAPPPRHSRNQHCSGLFCSLAPRLATPLALGSPTRMLSRVRPIPAAAPLAAGGGRRRRPNPSPRRAVSVRAAFDLTNFNFNPLDYLKVPRGQTAMTLVSLRPFVFRKHVCARPDWLRRASRPRLDAAPLLPPPCPSSSLTVSMDGGSREARADAALAAGRGRWILMGPGCPPPAGPAFLRCCPKLGSIGCVPPAASGARHAWQTSHPRASPLPRSSA